MEPKESRRSDDRGLQTFVESLVARAARLRFPELFQQQRPDALFQLRDREGVSVVVLETAALAEEELTSVLRYTLAQYLVAGFADPWGLYEAGIEHEPHSSVSASDLHLLAGNADSGEILCYMKLHGVRPALPSVRMRSRIRPLFSVEEMHGAGIFDRLRILSELPAAKVREFGRFVKNHRLHAFDEVGARAPIEIGVALVRALTGPLHGEVEALIGEAEESVALRNLDFFNFPTVTIRGTIPYEAPSFLYHYEDRTFYPFAVLVSDVVAHALPRVAAIEEALKLPGKKGVLALLRLKRTGSCPRSSLEPPEGLPPLAAVEIPHAHIPLPERKELREAGELLRQVDPFEKLTPAEATVLRTFMRRRTAPEGEIIVRQGEEGDAVFVIEDGEAEVRTTARDGTPRVLGRLGPGTYFGEIALVMGIRRTADVVALTPMTLLELSVEDYQRYLSTIGDVEKEFVVVAANRLVKPE